jgi:signal transduction histidine kinase
MLVHIAQLLTTLDLDEVLMQIISLTTNTVGAARGSFFLWDEDGRALQRFIAARHLPTQVRQTVSERIMRSGLAGWVVENKTPAIVDDTLVDPRWITLQDDTEHRRVRSAICVPFFVGGALRGVMTLEHPTPGHFTPADLRLLEAAANQGGAALRNAQLFDRVQSQQRQLEAVLNSISEALIVVDADLQVKILNPAALALVGASHDDDLTGFRLDELSAEFGNPLFARLKAQMTQAAQNAHNASRLDGRDPRAPNPATQFYELRDDATRRDYSLYITPFALRASGEAHTQPDAGGFIIALHDVTSLKDLNRLKTHMIQMASHDLKNPIGVLRGYLDVIKGDANNGLLPAPIFLDNMAKAIARMDALVVTLLDIQRAEQHSPLKRDLIDPYQLIEAIWDDMSPTAERHQHILVRNVQANLKPFTGDFIRLREAMDNLVENALKYTPPGGKITITVFSEEERFSFNVKDTGYGIPADQQPGVFQPYFRASQPETAHIPGTGIGLSLVKEVIERHGGQVWFTSTEGQGSTFGFWLPLLV